MRGLQDKGSKTEIKETAEVSPAAADFSHVKEAWSKLNSSKLKSGRECCSSDWR